ncbi:MAG: hypothetical protein KDM63_20880 [Verrucomicrobiae bacterium]|nr:hypothetical protein [Verrucomicrobiae bacterium]
MPLNAADPVAYAQNRATGALGRSDWVRGRINGGDCGGRHLVLLGVPP